MDFFVTGIWGCHQNRIAQGTGILQTRALLGEQGRPPIPSEVACYDLWHHRRLSMKPGLTCLWQCARNRNEIDFKQWMRMDLEYIDHWSLWLDFKILFKTVFCVFRGDGR